MKLTGWRIRCDMPVINEHVFASRKEAKDVADWLYKCNPYTTMKERPYRLTKVRCIVVL